MLRFLVWRGILPNALGNTLECHMHTENTAFSSHQHPSGSIYQLGNVILRISSFSFQLMCSF